MLAKTTTDKQRHWLKHVKAADLTDGTVAEYAAAHDVSLKSLYTVKRHQGQWKTKLIRLKLYHPAACSPEPDFVPVSPSSVQSSLPNDRSGCTVTLSNGTRIEFHGELSAHMIRTIMTTMSQAH